LLKNNHVQQVSAASYEANGERTDHFILEQQISGDNSTIVTTTEYPSTGKSVSTSYYENDKVVKTINDAENIESTTTYTYDSNNLQSIATDIQDTFMNNSSQEIHQWRYENNQPTEMLLIKDKKDTTVLEFVKDEQGNIAEEHWRKNGRLIGKYFYYYNDQHGLTDIVRFNARAQRLLPDFLFEYDNNSTLIQLTQIPQGSDNYLVWQYIYLPNGLKQKELCFNKQKQPVGRIEYSYH
jgi:antitoxin component YwqK of YwqJK toxin-antitoxin module